MQKKNIHRATMTNRTDNVKEEMEAEIRFMNGLNAMNFEHQQFK